VREGKREWETGWLTLFALFLNDYNRTEKIKAKRERGREGGREEGHTLKDLPLAPPRAACAVIPGYSPLGGPPRPAPQFPYETNE